MVLMARQGKPKFNMLNFFISAKDFVLKDYLALSTETEMMMNVQARYSDVIVARPYYVATDPGQRTGFTGEVATKGGLSLFLARDILNRNYKGLRPFIDFRTILLNEIIFDIDNEDWEIVKSTADKIKYYLESLNIPYKMYGSGGKGIHIQVLQATYFLGAVTTYKFLRRFSVSWILYQFNNPFTKPKADTVLVGPGGTREEVKPLWYVLTDEEYQSIDRHKLIFSDTTSVGSFLRFILSKKRYYKIPIDEVPDSREELIERAGNLKDINLNDYDFSLPDLWLPPWSYYVGLFEHGYDRNMWTTWEDNFWKVRDINPSGAISFTDRGDFVSLLDIFGNPADYSYDYTQWQTNYKWPTVEEAERAGFRTVEDYAEHYDISMEVIKPPTKTRDHWLNRVVQTMSKDEQYNSGRVSLEEYLRYFQRA